MQFSRLSALGFVTLAAVAIVSPSGVAHNPTKYIGVPFIVPAACTQDGNSSQFATINRQLTLLVVTNNTDDPGFAVFTSGPGSGVSEPQESAFPAGVITFNQSGLPSGATIMYDVFYNNGGVSIGNTASLSPNGLVTINTTSQSGTLLPIDVDVQILNSTGTIKLTNFHLNNQVLLGDTTHTIDPCGT